MSELDLVLGELARLAFLEKDKEAILKRAIREGYSIVTISRELGSAKKTISGIVGKQGKGGWREGGWKEYDELSELGNYVRAKRGRNRNIVRALWLGASYEEVGKLVGLSRRQLNRIREEELKRNGS